MSHFHGGKSEGARTAVVNSDSGSGIARAAPGADAERPTGGQDRENLVEAQQLMKIAPKILQSKGCFEAIWKSDAKICC